VAAAEEAVAAAGAAVAAVVEALASPPPAPTPPVPIEARSDPPAPLPVGLMAPDEITPAHTAGRHRGEAAAPMPAAHPTYAGTHSAKSSAVAYSRLINPRRGPTGSAEETDTCFMVCDHNRQPLTYVYFEDEPGRRAAGKLLTRDEARRVATNVAKLADLLKISASSPIEKPMVALNSPMATDETGGAFRSIFLGFRRLVGCPKNDCLWDSKKKARKPMAKSHLALVPPATVIGTVDRTAGRANGYTTRWTTRG
jgi:hypothetical protein